MNVLLKEGIRLTAELLLQFSVTVLTVYLGVVEKTKSQSLAALVIAVLLEIGSNQKYRAKISSSFESLVASSAFVTVSVGSSDTFTFVDICIHTEM